MALLAYPIMILIGYDLTKRLVKDLKKRFLVEDYEPDNTIIGEEYQWVHNGRQAAMNPSPVMKIRKGLFNGSDVEQARCWKDLSVAFGPLYHGLQNEDWKQRKKEAWLHVLSNSSTTTDGQVEETTRRVIEAIASVEKEARALYGGASEPSIDTLSSDEFIWMMILDGCFLLQVTLLVLGGSKQLNYPRRDRIFGQPEGDKAFIRIVLSSMFIVGNQIPSFVLAKLMQQTFFKKMFNRGMWKQPLDMERRVLFDLVIVPMLNISRSEGTISGRIIRQWRLGLSNIREREETISVPSWWLRIGFLGKHMHSVILCLSRVEDYVMLVIRMLFMFKSKKKNSLNEAHDILHGLWSLMMNSSSSNGDGDFQSVVGGDSSDGHYDVVHPTMRTATELKEAGINFTFYKFEGIKGIRFRNIFDAFLVLPKITIDSETEMLLCNMIHFEVAQEQDENKRTICAYLELMRELIQTHEDVRILVDSGVIVVADHTQGKEVPKLFQDLPLPTAKTPHRINSLSNVRNKLICYTRPSQFKKISDVLSVVIILAIVQTVYAALSFHLHKS